MLTLLMRVAAAAATNGGATASASDTPLSLFDALSFKTRALLRAASVASSGNSTGSFVDFLTPTAPSFPILANFLPSQSALLACVLALVLYVISWTALAARTSSSEEDERTNASFSIATATKKIDTPKQQPLIRLLYSFFHIFMLAYQCGVFVIHFLLNRAVPFRNCSVYLRGFSCATMPDDWTVSSERFRRTALHNFGLADKAAEFCMKLLGRSGLGESTYFPPGLMSYPPDLSMQSARAEADYIFGNALDQLFASTGIHPRDVDILVVNCSLFAPTPSLAAMIVNKYKMREDIQSYNLSGMGCSAGLISLHLAKDLLRTHPNSLAVIVSTELITQQIYTGTETNMLLQNSLFRSGGAAIALTNKSSDFAFGCARYELEHTVRTCLAADDQAYKCVFQDEDKDGHRGVKLEKELMMIAGKAMTKNIARLGPKILPWSELLKYAGYALARTLDTKFRVLDRLERLGWISPPPPPSAEELKKLQEKKEKEQASQPGATPKKERYKSRISEYTPNFKKAVDHICIHAGGRAVIDAIQAGLSLTDDDVAASRATLKRYGNTSSSSIWYEFRYCEQNRGVKKGEKIWQLGFGSGFKCNSAVWRKL